MHVGDQVAVPYYVHIQACIWNDYANNEYNMRHDHNVYGSN